MNKRLYHDTMSTLYAIIEQHKENCESEYKRYCDLHEESPDDEYYNNQMNDYWEKVKILEKAEIVIK